MKLGKFNQRDSYKLDTERTVRRFALFPTKLSDGMWIWLELYYNEQVRETKIIKNSSKYNIPLTMSGWILPEDRSDYYEYSWITKRRFQ